MNSRKLQAKQDTLKSLPCPSTQSSLLNPRGSSLSSQFLSLNSHSPSLSFNSPAPILHRSAQSPPFSPQHRKESATRCLQHNDELATDSPQHLFIDVSTALLRRGQSVRFRAPGRSMHPAIKERETITVVPVAPFDVKRGDILLYLVGNKVVAHRVVSIKKEKSNSTSRSLSNFSTHSSSNCATHSSTQSSTHSTPLIPKLIFILRGDASRTCDDPVEAQQVLGKVVSVERGGRFIDLYSRRAKMFRIAYALASRLKRLILGLWRITSGGLR